MLFIVGIEREDKATVAAHIVDQLHAPGVNFVVAVRPESFAFAMIVVSIITECVDSPLDRRVAGEQIITAV